MERRHKVASDSAKGARVTVKFKVDTSGLEEHYKTLMREIEKNVDAVMTKSVSAAEEVAVEIINKQIYNTPERGYKRTGALRDSVYAVLIKKPPNVWELEIGALGSSARSYALYNERGTYAGRMELDAIMRDAIRASARVLIHLEYGDPASGLEPRPWTIPAVVTMNRELFEQIERAISDAEIVARRSSR